MTQESVVYKSRAYLWVLHEPTDEEMVNIKNLHQGVLYHIAALEVTPSSDPENPKYHIQAFTRFKNPVNSPAFVRMITDGKRQFYHSKPNGTDEDQQRYCKKGLQSKSEYESVGALGPNYGKDLNLLVEFGTPSYSGKRNDIISFRDDMKKAPMSMRECLDKHPTIVARNPRFINTCRAVYHPPPDDRVGQNHKATNLWIWGPSQVGKTTRFAMPYLRKKYGQFVMKTLNKWFPDGYNLIDPLLLDDFHPDHAKSLVSELKQWAHSAKCSIEIKNITCEANPAAVVITSQYSIDTVFAGCSLQDLEAIHNRFREIHVNSTDDIQQYSSEFL